jgi:glycosyltransferase involved in cell wall biosynthesis
LIVELSKVDPVWKAVCAVVIPCLNEGETIGGLVKQVREHLPTVVVIDDGSSDGTGERAREAGAEVIGLNARQGKGAALITGWRHLAEGGFTWALSMDGDGQHSPDDIPKFLNEVSPDLPALVVGNRMVDSAAMPWVRRQENRWMSLRLTRRAGFPLPDSQCGFRLLHLGSFSRMELMTRHFEIESELVLAAVRLGIPIRFVPVQVIYRRGQSKISPVADSLRWFRWFLQRRS